MIVSPRLRLRTRLVPFLGRTQVMTPVSTTTRSRLPVTRTAVAGAAAAPGVRRYSAAGAVPAPTACADHFSDPSGQKPVAQLCIGTGRPSEVDSANDWSLPKAPRGHGTPKVTPAAGTAGVAPSSQVSGTSSGAGAGERGGCAAGAGAACATSGPAAAPR
jgi:hypothetical protein